MSLRRDSAARQACSRPTPRMMEGSRPRGRHARWALWDSARPLVGDGGPCWPGGLGSLLAWCSPEPPVSTSTPEIMNGLHHRRSSCDDRMQHWLKVIPDAQATSFILVMILSPSREAPT